MPLDELAVHEPDARKLIAFLKAMEFSSLTRRVAEYSQIDPADVEADAGNKSGGKSLFLASPACGGGRIAQRSGWGPLRSGWRPIRQWKHPHPALPRKRERERTAQPAGSERQDKAAASRAHPHLPRRRARGSSAENPESTAANTRRSARLDELNSWIARVHDVGHFAIDAKANSIDPMQAEISGIALALGPNDACYIPLAHKQSGEGAGLFAAGLAPDQIRASDALEALRPVLEFGRHPEDRLQHQIQRRDAGAAWRHHRQPRRRAADELRA